MRRLAVLPLVLLAGCTSINTVQVAGRGADSRDVFVLAGDLYEPYDSLGLLQVTRRGVVVFGFADPAGTDLEAALRDLYPEVRRKGGEGIINVRFSQTQYPLAGRLVGALFFFIPLPSEVTITGEVVRLRRSGPSQGVRP